MIEQVLLGLSLASALYAYYAVYGQDVRPIAVKVLWGLQLGSTLYLFLEKVPDWKFGIVSHVGLLVFSDMLWRDPYEDRKNQRRRRILLIYAWSATLLILHLGTGWGGKYHYCPVGNPNKLS